MCGFLRFVSLHYYAGTYRSWISQRIRPCKIIECHSYVTAKNRETSFYFYWFFFYSGEVGCVISSFILCLHYHWNITWLIYFATIRSTIRRFIWKFILVVLNVSLHIPLATSMTFTVGLPVSLASCHSKCWLWIWVCSSIAFSFTSANMNIQNVADNRLYLGSCREQPISLHQDYQY